MWIFWRKRQPGSEKATCVNISALHLALKLIHTSIELAFVADHKHYFPLEYVAIGQPAGDAWDIFVGLHLFELTGQ